MQARENIGSTNYETLFSGKHELDTTIVTIKAGNKHVRGEVLAIDSEKKKCEIAGTEGHTVAYILAEDVDATKADANAVAYKSGGFIKNALIVKAGYSLTATDVDTLRNAGIYLEDAQL